MDSTHQDEESVSSIDTLYENKNNEPLFDDEENISDSEVTSSPEPNVYRRSFTNTEF